MPTMKVTVCELINDPARFEDDWRALADHTRAHGSELVLLPEMPFHPWLAATRDVDPEAWAEAVRAHEEWGSRLGEPEAATVVATRPVIDGGEHRNRGFVWTKADGELSDTHDKRYLPDEEGFWEASWYARGDGDFTPVDVAGTRLGFQICTEMWFFEHSRAYGKQGVRLLACPRATLSSSVDKWLAGGRAAAVVSGAFCLSSNFSGGAGEHGEWGGTGWIVEPEEGEVLGTTSREEPFLTLDLDLGVAEAARATYPRYVLD